MYASIFPREAAALSPDTLAECVNTLRYLAAEQRANGGIDLVNMRHVTAALARVESEINDASPAPLKFAAERATFAAAQEKFSTPLAAE